MPDVQARAAQACLRLFFERQWRMHEGGSRAAVPPMLRRVACSPLSGPAGRMRYDVFAETDGVGHTHVVGCLVCLRVCTSLRHSMVLFTSQVGSKQSATAAWRHAFPTAVGPVGHVLRAAPAHWHAAWPLRVRAPLSMRLVAHASTSLMFLHELGTSAGPLGLIPYCTLLVSLWAICGKNAVLEAGCVIGSLALFCVCCLVRTYGWALAGVRPFAMSIVVKQLKRPLLQGFTTPRVPVLHCPRA